MAGVEECFCWTNCDDLSPACGAVLEPGRLELDVEQGDTTEGWLYAIARMNDDFLRCPIDFVVDEPWAELSVEWSDYLWADITVTVDASELPIGIHTATVRAESECVECSEIVVNVREPSAVAETEDGVAIKNLGGIKLIYR
jgi:hypothetical protein